MIRDLLNLVTPRALLVAALAMVTVSAEVRQSSASSFGAAGQDARADLNAAFTALNDGDMARAGEHLKRAEAVAGREPRFIFLSGRYDIAREEWESAVARFEALRRVAPTYEPAWSRQNAGFALYSLGRHEEAEGAFSEALARPASELDVRMYQNSIRNLLAWGKTPDALRRTEDGLALFPRDPWLWDYKAWCLKLAGQHEEARSAARQAGTFWDASASKTIPSMVLSPLAGRVYVLQGPGGAFSHENLNSRFAWDLQTVDVRGRTFLTDGRTNEDFPSFGATVRAVADGVVVQSHDGVQDHGPGAPNARIAGGNHVVISHDAFYSFVFHLKRGSLLVKRGDRVTAGQPVGQVGNSGYSTAPHVHFTISATKPPVNVSVPARLRCRAVGARDDSAESTDLGRGTIMTCE